MDRLDVIDTCTRMAWHVDHREWDELATVFTDRVRLDYTSLNGGEPVTLSPAQLVAAWRDTLGGFAATQHLLGNHLVTIDSDAAVCTASFQATHRGSEAFGATLWTLGGSYRFDLVRSAGGWRISGIVMTAAWGDGNRGLLP
ncbi:nuclear transport factor 2 family protein [Nocardia cyriacigeorgica]|uniref:Nuclear transport factor 2 family protein n=1 Tax=Nocardia cyriacigeorgica TaxID=135487 RepID=A0A5R8NBW8_9NOCA|nr:nuclear transport factor 2 family protein [Nocardia cyriacigeorgica]TLF73215.1 nuclear transport factor 2 family protein [Nocardia cyriacigeorgica]